MKLAALVILLAPFPFLWAAQALAADVLVPKAQFLEGMKAGFPESFCADKTYFRQCFSLPKGDCAKAVAAAVPGCVEKTQADIPAQLHQPADGQKWGEKLGNCVGAKFEEAHAKERLKKPECEDASKWK